MLACSHPTIFKSQYLDFNQPSLTTKHRSLKTITTTRGQPVDSICVRSVSYGNKYGDATSGETSFPEQFSWPCVKCFVMLHTVNSILSHNIGKSSSTNCNWTYYKFFIRVLSEITWRCQRHICIGSFFGASASAYAAQLAFVTRDRKLIFLSIFSPFIFLS